MGFGPIALNSCIAETKCMFKKMHPPSIALVSLITVALGVNRHASRLIGTLTVLRRIFKYCMRKKYQKQFRPFLKEDMSDFARAGKLEIAP
tara:strand:+ start:415 stop:687 length:273 start_codon:yes stop_codon:yes gene_type:complete